MAQTLLILGTALQVLGVGSVWLGVRRTRLAFTELPGIEDKAKGVANRVADRFRALRDTLLRRQMVAAGESAPPAGEFAAMDTTTTLEICGHAPPVDPVERLKAELDALQDEVNGLRTDFATERRDRVAADQEMARAVAEVSGRLAELAGGGLHLESRGAAAIMVGIALRKCLRGWLRGGCRFPRTSAGAGGEAS